MFNQKYGGGCGIFSPSIVAFDGLKIVVTFFNQFKVESLSFDIKKVFIGWYTNTERGTRKAI